MKKILNYAYYPAMWVAAVYFYMEQNYLALLMLCAFTTTLAGLMEFLADLYAKRIELLSSNAEDNA